MKKKMIIKEQKGVAAVEFAIILPVLLLVLFGIIEFGIMFYDQAMMTNAAREGARAGIVYIDEDDRLCNSGITAVVNTYAQNHLINFSSNSLVVPTSLREDKDGNPTVNCKGKSGGTLTVTVKYQYDFLLVPNMAELFPGGPFAKFQNLTAICRMRFE
ncbi:TadE/TadG family type IV pilus assembly protein [Thermodesulfobacteriota bacterium]